MVTSSCVDGQKAPEDNAAAVTQVLTSRTLFPHITSFMSGLPYLVVAFKREALEKHPPVPHTHTPSQAKYPNHTYGFLPHAAIKDNNLRVLEVLFELQKQPQYRWTHALYFNQVMRCAAFFRRLEMLEWMARERTKDPMWL